MRYEYRFTYRDLESGMFVDIDVFNIRKLYHENQMIRELMSTVVLEQHAPGQWILHWVWDYSKKGASRVGEAIQEFMNETGDQVGFTVSSFDS